VAFVIAGQPTAGGEPSQSSFDHPPARMDREALLLGGFADDLQRDLEGVAGPLDEPVREALVREDVPDRGGEIGAEQGGLRAVAVLPTRRHHGHGDQQPAVSVTMNRFLPLIFFPAS
jgi:hypothetical protein